MPVVTYDGWVWLDGYQVDRNGLAIARREIYVQPSQLRKLGNAPAADRFQASLIT